MYDNIYLFQDSDSDETVTSVVIQSSHESAQDDILFDRVLGCGLPGVPGLHQYTHTHIDAPHIYILKHACKWRWKEKTFWAWCILRIYYLRWQCMASPPPSPSPCLRIGFPQRAIEVHHSCSKVLSTGNHEVRRDKERKWKRVYPCYRLMEVKRLSLPKAANGTYIIWKLSVCCGSELQISVNFEQSKRPGLGWLRNVQVKVMQWKIITGYSWEGLRL